MLNMRLNANVIIRAVDKAIALNPTTFTVKHVERVLVDGAYEEVERETEYTGIIYLEDNSNLMKIVSEIKGTEYSTSKYKMVLNNKEEIKIDEKNRVEFDCNEGHMKITGAYPVFIDNTLCCYFCDLERM